MELDYNELVQFMKDFKVDYMNRFGELIIDDTTNTYATINHCKDMGDVEVAVVYALCRPIGKGLKKMPATRLLNNLNRYFDTELTRDDMHLMYRELCYADKLDEFKDFVARGFPMNELSWCNA